MSIEENGITVVTGGLGFVGGHLVRHLHDAGARVVVADIADPAAVVLPPGIGYRRADLRDPGQAAAALAGAGTVFHLAGNPSGTRSVENPLFDFGINALGTANLCAGAVSAGVSRLVYLSSAMVYGRPRVVPMPETHATEPFLPYGASKLAGEHVVRAFGETFGLDTVVARAFTLYGPGEDPRTAGGEVSQYLRWHLNGLPVQAAGDLDRKTRDFAHISDVVRALELVAQRGERGATYNLGTGAEYSLRQLVDTISSATGREVELVVDASVTEDTYRHVPDIDRLRGLGFQPEISLDEGVARLAAELGPSPELPAVPTYFKPARPIAS
ncbi:NAD-dependent epimerase/dehydratase family protein [Amycolatopsis japonica]|uniref:NAD-dependent epimerase/dehydratase family protein n=1 Tax=Amycolatopsis japonica TaxID=208439 RepID=UPI00366AA6B3